MGEIFRRIVTAHDAAGRAMFVADDILSTKPIPGGDAAFELVWTTPSVPADLNAGTDGINPAGLTLAGGSVIRVVDMLPGKSSPMHRSFSIDYGIVMSGVLELELEGGDVARLGAGDIVVQRGTNHLWRNPSDTEVCRIVFVLIEATPIRIGDRILEEIHP